MIRKTSYVSNIIQTFNSIYPFNFIIVQCPEAQSELFLTWLQRERTNFSYGHALASLWRYITKAPGYKNKGLPVLSPLCPHSSLQPLHVVSTLWFLPKVRNKSPWPWGIHSCYYSPDVSTLLFLVPPSFKKKPHMYLNLHLFPFSSSEHSTNHLKKLRECVCTCVCASVCVYARTRTFLPVSIPPPLPKRKKKRWREGRRDFVSS